MATVGISLNDIDRGQISAAVNGTLIEGSKVSSWWKSQERSLVTNVTRTIRAGLNNGLTSQQIAANLRSNAFKGTRAQAQALVSTGINAVSNKARVASFEENKDVIKGYQQVSTFDSRTSDICIAYSGMAWDFDGNPLDENTTLPFNGGPPRHFNCRSTLVPVIKSFEELGVAKKGQIPPGTRASMDGQIAADTTFSAWLRTKPKTFQDKLLGPARAKLWRGNRITLSQLVDMRGNPLSVEQLLERARKKRRKTPTPAAAAPVAAAPPPPAPVEAEPWEGVPEFRSGKDGAAWIRNNAVNREGRYALAKDRISGDVKDVSENMVASWDKTGMRVTAMVTKMMERRFGMPLPNYIGRADKHPEFRFRGRNSLASVHMESDSLLLRKAGIDVKHQGAVVKNLPRALERRAARRGDKYRLMLQQEGLEPELKASLQKGLDTEDWVFTVGDNGLDANGLGPVWRTIVHESGHRLHAHHRTAIDGILNREFGLVYNGRLHKYSFDRAATEQQKLRYSAWKTATSEYAEVNPHELVAESFTRYMNGEGDRVLPSLRRFFEDLDSGGPFGTPPELR